VKLAWIAAARKGCASPGVTNEPDRSGLRIGRSQLNPGSRAAVLSQAGALLSWTSEGADTFFVRERVRKAAADRRQPQRAERAMDIGASGHALSSASDDEVGGCQARSALSELSERNNQTRAEGGTRTLTPEGTGT
jgi:hypothetical protein